MTFPRLLCAGSAALLFLTCASAMAEEGNGSLPPGVIARQGNAEVTMQDIDAYALRIPEGDRVGFFDSPTRIQSVILNLLLQKQLVAEAHERKVDSDPVVQRALQQASDEALSRAAIDNYRKSLTPPNFEKMAGEYYLAHKDEFVIHGRIDVEHVLVSNKERSDAEATARANEVAAAAKQHPDQFEQLVEQYSDDPSKPQNHGLMEDAGSDRYAPPFAEAAKQLKKPGQISPVIKTQYGYHVLKLVSRQPDRQRTQAEVHDELVLKLRNEFLERETKDHVNSLRDKPLDANPDLVAEVRTHFLKPGQKLPSEVAEAANAASLKEAQQQAAQKAAEDKH